MKLRNAALAAGIALGLVVGSAAPAFAYASSTGTTSCSGVRSVSIFGTQNDTVRHWYYATGIMKQYDPAVIGPYYYWQTYSGTQSRSWKIETFGAFKSGTAKGGTCH